MDKSSTQSLTTPRRRLGTGASDLKQIWLIDALSCDVHSDTVCFSKLVESGSSFKVVRIG